MERKAEERAKLRDGAGKQWETMDPCVLGLVFACIPLDMMARTVPLVCRRWWYSLKYPAAWTKVDLRKWTRCNNSSFAQETVPDLILCSEFFIVSLKAQGISRRCFNWTLNCGSMLTVLKMPSSQVSDQEVMFYEKFCLPNLTTLDISDCPKITSKGIKSFGKQAKKLVKLRRNMPRWDYNGATKVKESEAKAVAHYMPGLQHLELGSGFFSDRGLDLILTSCTALGYLDILGCWNVKLDEKMKERCDRIFFFRDPHGAEEGKMKTDR